MAQAARDAGAQLFEQQKFAEALEKFNEGLSAIANDSASADTEDGRKLHLSCQLNVASCLVKLGRFDDAVVAADAALKIDKKSGKAMYRRGQARRGLKQFGKARFDLMMASEMCGDDPAINAELAAVRKEEADAKASGAAPATSTYTPSVRSSAISSSAPSASTSTASAFAAPPRTVSYTGRLAEVKTKADNGDTAAMMELGEILEDGKEGQPKNPNAAFEWYITAARAGDAKAQNFTGWCFKVGFGTTANAQEAVGWYEKSAAQGNIKAQACLGFLYEKGEGCPQDLGRSVEFYRQAAEQGDNVAMQNLALAYEKGRGVNKDEPTALEWFTRAADAGNLNSIINVGLYYEKGQGGVAKDMTKAFSWYMKAAERGDHTGQAIIGSCFENGQGVPKDEMSALDWYTRSAKQGNGHAKQGLQRLMGTK